MTYENHQDVLNGPHGRAVRLTLPDRPDAAETVCSWLITSPIWHPGWSQYNLFVVRLREGVPGFPDPKLKFDGATHELLVAAVNPEHGPMTQKRIEERDWSIPWLTPINIAEQFEATDDEMLHLAGLCVLNVLRGVLNPETSDSPALIREGWLTAMVRTLAHLRGEAHAAPPQPAPRRHGPYMEPQPGETIEMAIAPGVTRDKRKDVEAMMARTHDGLIQMLGDRRRSGIRWHHVHGQQSCNEWLDKYVTTATPERLAAVNSMVDQYRAFITEHPDCVIVVAECDAAR